jgi:23S rRNA pseudouridine955/2504/2580 synthase
MKLRPEDIILFEDDNLIILNKPAGIVSDQENAPGLQSFRDMVQRVRPEAMLCHRLDRDTSGVIIAAKNAETYRDISIKLQKRQIIKEYYALVAGVHSWPSQLIELPLRKQGSLKSVVDKKEGKKAETLVETAELFKNFTLIKAQPITGRFHQIRVHLASVGCPLVGDELYGGKPFYLSEIKRKFNTSKGEEELPMMNRAALHARRISFEYPEGKTFEIEAPYPKDFEVTLKMLRKFNAVKLS